MPTRIARPHCYRALLSRIPDASTDAQPTRNATDGRTDGLTRDPHSPSATNPLFSDARAHIRGMDVDK